MIFPAEKMHLDLMEVILMAAVMGEHMIPVRTAPKILRLTIPMKARRTTVFQVMKAASMHSQILNQKFLMTDLLLWMFSQIAKKSGTSTVSQILPTMFLYRIQMRPVWMPTLFSSQFSAISQMRKKQEHRQIRMYISVKILTSIRITNIRSLVTLLM